MAQLRSIGLLVLAASGCGACDEERSVPFKRDEASAASVAAPAPDAAKDAGMLAGFEPVLGRVHPEGTRRIDVGSDTIEVATGSLRASLEVDLDADGDLDLLVVSQGEDGALALARAERGAQGLTALEQRAALATSAPDCAIEAVTLEGFAPAFVAARAATRCRLTVTAAEAAATPSATAPGAPVPAATSPRHARDLWIATLESLPRVATHFAWSNPEPNPPAGPSFGEVTLGRDDLDGDGHGDVKVSLALAPAPGEPPFSLGLAFFDRPAGLARDPAEPEATLLGLADAARAVLRKDPERALVEAERALALHEALCREPGHPRVVLADVPGLPCGRSRAAGRAGSVRVAALAKLGRLLAAVEQLEALEGESFALADPDRARARDAVGAHVAKDRTWRAGPSIAPATRPAGRLGALGFLDEESVLLREPAARSLRVGALTAEPIGISGDVLVRDPKGALAAVEIVRSCEGPRVRIVRAEQIVAGIVGGASVAEPLVAQEPPPAGARCPAPLSTAQRKDDGGWRILDWTDAGLVLARGSSLWQLALDAEGKALAPARKAAPADALRATHPGALSEDGRYFAVPTTLGIAIVERATDTATLVPYAGSLEGAPAETIGDVAVSPSGRRIAVVHAGHVHVATEPTEVPPAPSAATASSPDTDPTRLPPPAP